MNWLKVVQALSRLSDPLGDLAEGEQKETEKNSLLIYVFFITQYMKIQRHYWRKFQALRGTVTLSAGMIFFRKAIILLTSANCLIINNISDFYVQPYCRIIQIIADVMSKWHQELLQDSDLGPERCPCSKDSSKTSAKQDSNCGQPICQKWREKVKEQHTNIEPMKNLLKKAKVPLWRENYWLIAKVCILVM